MVRPVLDGGPEIHTLMAALPTDGRLDRFVSDVLDAAHRRPADLRWSRPRPGADTLSERELDVLRYLASRLSYPDVARELYISVNTLKSHVKSIYRKLGAANRGEAIEVARRDGILG
jgi:LuxR family maltose regulon positive regulatory protein